MSNQQKDPWGLPEGWEWERVGSLDVATSRDPGTGRIAGQAWLDVGKMKTHRDVPPELRDQLWTALMRRLVWPPGATDV